MPLPIDLTRDVSEINVMFRALSSNSLTNCEERDGMFRFNVHGISSGTHFSLRVEALKYHKKKICGFWLPVLDLKWDGRSIKPVLPIDPLIITQVLGPDDVVQKDIYLESHTMEILRGTCAKASKSYKKEIERRERAILTKRFSQDPSPQQVETIVDEMGLR